MNTLDLTKTGGFPFTQDMLDWVQQNSLAVMNMLGAKLLPDSLATTANTPVALTGINPGTGTIYKAGWLLYNNEILRFPTNIDVSTLPTLTGGLVYGFSIQETDTPVSYFDGTTHNTKISRTVTIASGANALTASFIPLTTTVYYFDNGLKETAWATLASVPPTGITPTIKYRKNFLSNTVQLDISVAVSSGALAVAYLGGFAQLPAGYRPITDKNFTGSIVPTGTATIYDTEATPAPIVAIPVWIDNTGTINARVFPAAGAANYTFALSITLPLD